MTPTPWSSSSPAPTATSPTPAITSPPSTSSSPAGGPAEDRDFWLHAADVSRELFNRVTNPTTGLAPDRSNFDFSQMTERDGKPVPFSYDSWRTASNWSVDASWWHKDPRQTTLSDHIQAFLISQGISAFVDRYTLDGKPLRRSPLDGYVSGEHRRRSRRHPRPNEKAFIEELWRTPIPNGDQRYFDGMLYLMSYLHASGNFRISDWQLGPPLIPRPHAPTPVPAPQSPAARLPLRRYSTSS